MNEFSIQNPEYRYPHSHNLYWSKLLELKGRVFSDNDTELHPGGWRTLFSDQVPSPDRELHVEIGCNAGHVLTALAQRNPNHAYIGIDWKFKSIFRAHDKAMRKELRNTLFFRAHAQRIAYMFGNSELNSLSVFFPDPWPKQSQKKNRLISAEWLRQIAPLLKTNGILHIKTDHAGYFDWILKCLNQTQDVWEIVEFTRNLHENHPDPKSLKIPEVTLFERIFIREGIPIQSIRLRPLKANGAIGL